MNNRSVPGTVSRKYAGLMCRGEALVPLPAGVDKRSAAFARLVATRVLAAANPLRPQKLRPDSGGKFLGLCDERRLCSRAGLGWRRRPAFDGDADG